MGTQLGGVLTRGAAMAVEYTRYRVPTERADALVAAYRGAVMALQASVYWLGYGLTHWVEDRELFVLRIRWASIDDHLAAVWIQRALPPILHPYQAFRGSDRGDAALRDSAGTLDRRPSWVAGQVKECR
jgi:hypothetical protein